MTGVDSTTIRFESNMGIGINDDSDFYSKAKNAGYDQCTDKIERTLNLSGTEKHNMFFFIDT